MSDDTREGEDGLTFRRADDGDDVALRAINAEVFPANPKVRADITQWQWWQNPFGSTTAFVWEDDGVVVGQYVAFPMPALLDGRDGHVAIGVDVGVRESHRGRGLTRRLLLACITDAADRGMPFYSLPNEQSLRTLAPTSWVRVASLQVRVLPVDGAALAARLHLPGAAGRALGRAGTRVLGARSKVASGLAVTIDVLAEGGSVPEDIDALWAAVRHQHPWGVARHAEWWRWRYEAHPDRPYTVVSVRDRSGSLRAAAAVITRDDLGGRFHCLLELVAVDEDAARAVVGTIRSGAIGPADGIAATAAPGSRLAQLAGAAGLVSLPQRVLPRPVHFGVAPVATMPDPSTLPWSTSWGDLDHV